MPISQLTRAFECRFPKGRAAKKRGGFFEGALARERPFSCNYAPPLRPRLPLNCVGPPPGLPMDVLLLKRAVRYEYDTQRLFYFLSGGYGWVGLIFS